MRMTYLASVSVIALVTPVAQAECLPTFYAAGCSYKATHIVVVTTEPGGGGKFKVTESWKGDLKAGDAVVVPGLAKDAKGDMVLFMARNPDPKAAETWKPVGFDRWRESVVWFEGEKVLYVQQFFNPGPAEISEAHSLKGRKDFKSTVDYFLETERAFAAAEAVKDSAGRAAAFAKIVNGQFDRKDEAFKELGKCGVAALPALRAYLKEPTNFYMGFAVTALAAAGGKDVVPDLIAILDDELAYWKKVGPTLRPNWWYDTSAKNESYQRWCKLRSLFDAYAVQPTPAYRASMIAIRDYLRTIPTDYEKVAGLVNMPSYCDEVLKKVDR